MGSTKCPAVSDDKRVIMIVDDEPINIRVLLSSLKDDYKVKVAKNGEKALELIRKEPETLELILLDVEMPGLNGYEVCSALKSDPQTKGIPVVFVTGRDTAQDRAEQEKLGAAGVLGKPIEPELLKETVRSLLS